MASSSDVLVLTLGVILAALYLFRDQLFAASTPKSVPLSSSKANAGGGNPRDFIAKMKEGVSVKGPRVRVHDPNYMQRGLRKNA